MKDIKDLDYNNAKRLCNYLELKKLGEYPSLYLKTDTFLLADVFENVRRICSVIYKLDPQKFL